MVENKKEVIKREKTSKNDSISHMKKTTKRKKNQVFKFFHKNPLIIPTHYICCLKLALLSLILYHSFPFSLYLSISLFLSLSLQHREQLSSKSSHLKGIPCSTKTHNLRKR